MLGARFGAHQAPAVRLDIRRHNLQAHRLHRPPRAELHHIQLADPRLLLELGGDHRGAGGEEDDVSRHRPLLGDLIALEKCSAANTTSVSLLCFGLGGHRLEREKQQVVKVNQEEETHTGLHIMAMRSSSPRFTWLR